MHSAYSCLSIIYISFGLRAAFIASNFYFQSTRAIVFHNKVELSEHRFFGTIYGLVRDTIGAVVIIYGYKT